MTLFKISKLCLNSRSKGECYIVNTCSTVVPSMSKCVNVLYFVRSDQWSPLNPEGKKHYDRTFLLQLQYSTESIQKPDGLPLLPDVVLDTVSDLGHWMMIIFFTI